MAEKRVKVGKEFEHVPAVKSGRGWLGLEKGKTASVCYYASRKMLCLSVKEGKKVVRRFYKVEDYAKANAAAREANKIGEQAGAGFGALRKEEEAALKVWREFVEEETLRGRPPRKLDEILREIVEREREQTDTPTFKEVAFRFLEHKERRGDWSENMRARQFKKVAVLVKAPALRLKDGGSKKLADITEADAEAAVEQSVSGRRKRGEAMADATRAHWQKMLKGIFAWWYEAANEDRPQALQLKNPLRKYEVASVRNLDEPQIMSVKDARALLADLWEHERDAVPAVAVQMFCGVRNAEVARLRWKDIRRDAGILYLAKALTKTTQARSVPLPDNLAAWLDAYAAARGVPDADAFLIGVPVPADAAANIKERRRLAFVQHSLERAMKRTGASKPENAFRHTAISAMCVLHNEFLAAQWAGHDRKIQGEFYKAAMSKQDAKDYFGIVPPVSDGKAIAFSREGKKARSRGEAGAGSPSSSNHEETDGRGEAAAI